MLEQHKETTGNEVAFLAPNDILSPMIKAIPSFDFETFSENVKDHIIKTLLGGGEKEIEKLILELNS